MIDTPYLHRHPSEPNLMIYQGYDYKGMNLIWQHGPFIYNYLQRIDETIQGALQEHRSVMAVRVDLRLPFHFYKMNPSLNRPLFNRFIESLKAKIRALKNRTERRGRRFHATKVHYAWVREFAENGNPHYHCVLFFNKHTFRGLGKFNPHAEGLYGMISSAWASALGMEAHLTDGLVYIPKNSTYRIKRGKAYNSLFYRFSYFTKVYSKQFGLPSHNFGASRGPNT
jgi:hypothetical protein